MDRRELLARLARTGIASGAVSLVPQRFVAALAGGRASPPPHMRAAARPTADQIAWQDLELGMFVHFAPNTWQDAESDNLTTPLAAIDPKELSTDQWAATAVKLGAKYIVFVAKHQGGFCMWQTKTTDYSIRNTPWKNGRGDVLAEVASSCRKYGLKLGAYVCPRDDHFGARTGGICKTPELQAKYDAMYREQLTEVWSRYGPLVEIWFDGSTITPVADLLAKYQPHAMVFQGPQATIRWVGNEDGFAPYPCWNGIDRADARTGTATALESDPNGSVWMPSEVDVSIRRPDWFWSTKNEAKVLTEEQLLSIYYRSVGRGAQLLLNIPANRQGLLPEKDVAAAVAFGREVKRRFSQAVATSSGEGRSVTLTLPSPATIDTVILQEDIAGGERVRGYRIEGRSSGAWHSLGEGSAIGHKRIQPVQRTSVDAVRLIVTQAAALPAIRNLAVYDTGVAPPADWQAASTLWAPNIVGQWKANRFALDLTSAIHAAAQYRLRFVSSDGKVTGLRNVVLKLHGAPEPGMLKRSAAKPDELNIDITGVDETVAISGQVLGASAGQVLLQKR